MNRLLVVSLLTTISYAQDQQTALMIKGHSIGESLTVFLNKSGRTDALAQCRELVNRHRNDKQKIFPNRKEMDLAFDLKICRGIVNASDGSRSSFIERNVGEVEFNHGIFVGVKVDFTNSLRVRDEQTSFDAVLVDAVKKYGLPTAEGSTSWQNAFGATINPRYSQWNRPDVVVELREAPEMTQPGYLPDLTLTVVMRAENDALNKENAQKDAARPNTLDAK